MTQNKSLDLAAESYHQSLFELKCSLKKFESSVEKYHKHIYLACEKPQTQLCAGCPKGRAKKLRLPKDNHEVDDGKKSYICTFSSKHADSDAYVIHRGHVIGASRAALRLARQHVPQTDHDATCTARPVDIPTAPGLTLAVWPVR